MKLLLANQLIFDIEVKDMKPDEIESLNSLICQLSSGETTTVIVLSYSHSELETLATLILETENELNFTFLASAKNDFYLMGFLEESDVNMESLSYTDTFTASTVPVIPSIFASAAPLSNPPLTAAKLSSEFIADASSEPTYINSENGDLNQEKQLPTYTKETLLDWAVKNKAKEILELLLSLGADPTLCNKEGMSRANIAVRDKMSREIVLPLLNSNSTLYEFFDHFYSPESIQSLHYNAISECEDTKETLEIINFLIKSGIFPSNPEDITELEDSTSYLPKIKNLLPLAIEKSEWLIATAYLAYINPGLFYITPKLLDLIVKSEKIDLVAAALPHIHQDVFSNYMIPSVTLTANNTDYFRQLPLLFLVSGFRLQRIKIFSDRYPTLSEKINKPLPILLREARDNFKKFFGNVLDLSHQTFSLIDFKELLQTLEENTDITQIQLLDCVLDQESAGITRLDPTPEAEDLINKILFKLYLNNFNSLRKLVPLFLQWNVKFSQEKNLTQSELLKDTVKNIHTTLVKNHSENTFTIFVNCNKLIACIEQISGLNYVLTEKNLSSFTVEDLKTAYFKFLHGTWSVSLSQNPLSKILSDKLQKMVDKLKLELGKRKEVIPDFFDIAIFMLKKNNYSILQPYIHPEKGKISIRTRDKDNNTLLHHAVKCRALESTKILLKQPGCELDAINNQGETPFLLAIKSKNISIDFLEFLYQALLNSKIDPHASIPNTPLTIQNFTVATFLCGKGISMAGHDMQNRILYNFDPHSYFTGEKMESDELLNMVCNQDYNFLNLGGINFTLEKFKELAEKLKSPNSGFTRIYLSKSRLVEITELQSNEILDNIICSLFYNQCKKRLRLRLTQNLTLDQVITSITSIIETLKNEIGKPELSSLSLFNNTQEQILEFSHLFKTFGDILKTKNMALFTKQVILKLRELSKLLTSTPTLQNFPVFPILQTSCSDLNEHIIQLLSSLNVLESEPTELPEALTSAFETATLSEQAHADSPPSDTALSSDVPPSKDIPEEIHNIHTLKYIKALLVKDKLKKIEMDSFPKIDKVENYINADRNKAEDAIVNLQTQLSEILDTLDDLIEKSALIKIGKELQEKVNAYCNVMMGVNAYTKPYPLYCEIRSLAEQFNNEWEKILPANTSSIPAHSQNPATFLAPPTLPPPTSQPSANSSSSTPACAQFSFLT